MSIDDKKKLSDIAWSLIATVILAQTLSDGSKSMIVMFTELPESNGLFALRTCVMCIITLLLAIVINMKLMLNESIRKEYIYALFVSIGTFLFTIGNTYSIDIIKLLYITAILICYYYINNKKLQNTEVRHG